MDYKKLVDVYEKLESTTKNLEKTYYISKLLKETKEEDLEKIVLLIQGKVFPTIEESELGIAAQTAIKAITKSTGTSETEIKNEWRKIGDLGKVAAKLIEKKKQRTLSQEKLTIKKVFDNLRKLVEMTGSGSVDRKIGLVAELLSNANPKEAEYVIKTVLEQLRVGVGEGTLRDAIVWAFFPPVKGILFKCPKCHALNPKISKCLECNSEIDTKIKEIERETYKHYANVVQSAYDVTNDFAQIALIAKKDGEKGLQKAEISISKPIKVMLAQKEPTLHDAIERVGKPFAIEYKLDGFRIQVHKKGDDINLFTRRLDNVTKQFPEVVKYIKENVKAKVCLLDTEAVGFDPKTKKYRPFQQISQRIKRKYDIEKIQKQLPVELNVFDVLFHEEKDMIKVPFEERRKVIEKIIHEKERKIVLVKQLITDDEKKAQNFYEDSLAAGNEGVILKNLKAPYKPGSRVGQMVKFKPVLTTLDLVITGAEWGTGKRGGWLSSFVIACRDKGEFKDVGKVGTGFKEKEGELSFKEMTNLLKPLIIETKGRIVKIKPKIVIEIHYEEVQKSPTYGSGFALRFPRVVQLRADRGASECSTLQDLEEVYRTQRGRE